jgi:hypothetical protein
MALNIEPAVAMVPASGEVSNHVFTNLGKQRLVFKVCWCLFWKILLIFQCLGEGNEQRQLPCEARLGITRTYGPPKKDKFVVQFAAASPEENDNKN